MSHTIEIETTAVGPASGAPRSQLHGASVAAAIGYAPILVESLSASVREVINVVAAAIDPGADGPESCQVKFGLKVSGAGNVILAKMGSELNLEITINWKRPAPAPPSATVG